MLDLLSDILTRLSLRGTLYFRTSPATVADYDAADAGWFQPNPQQALKTYREVPAAVLDRRPTLVAWALRAIAC